MRQHGRLLACLSTFGRGYFVPGHSGMEKTFEAINRTGFCGCREIYNFFVGLYGRPQAHGKESTSGQLFSQQRSTLPFAPTRHERVSKQQHNHNSSSFVYGLYSFLSTRVLVCLGVCVRFFAARPVNLKRWHSSSNSNNNKALWPVNWLGRPLSTATTTTKRSLTTTTTKRFPITPTTITTGSCCCCNSLPRARPADRLDAWVTTMLLRCIPLQVRVIRFREAPIAGPKALPARSAACARTPHSWVRPRPGGAPGLGQRI